MSMFDDQLQEYVPMDKYAAHAAISGDAMGLPSKIIHGAVATAADIGTTYWNSLTPQSMEVSTQDLLSRIDADALQIYNENPDTIKTLSFVGGLVIPLGLSLKGMNMLRAGTKGLSWFSEAGQASKLATVESAFASTRYGMDAAFIKAKWDVYRGVAMNAVADNVAAEIALLGTMSAHPYMEDYFKDFGSNFVKSIAFGVGVQTGIGSIIAKYDIAKRVAPTQQKLFGTIKADLFDSLTAANISARSHLGEEAAIKMQAFDNMKAAVEAADNGTVPLSPYIRGHLDSRIQAEEAALVTKIKETAQGAEMQKFLENEDKDAIGYVLKFFARDDIAGLDKIGFAEVKGTTAKLQTPGILQPSASLFQTVVKKVKNAAGIEEDVTKVVKTDAIFTPLNGGTFIAKSEAPYYLQAADLGQTVEQLEKIGIPFKGKAVDDAWGISLVVQHSAEADKDFITAILGASKMDLAEMAKVPIVSDHLPLLKAFYIQGDKLLIETPEATLSLRLLTAEGEKTITSLDDLATVIVEAQTLAVKELKEAGFGIETIALKTGTPIDTIERIILNGGVVENAGLIKYASKVDVEQALHYTNRSLALSTDMNKVPQPEMLAKLNARNLDASSTGILEQTLLSSRSETVRSLAEDLLSADTKQLVSFIYDDIDKAAPSLLKSSFFASTNQVTEALGPLGSYINYYGKKLGRAKNNLSEAFEKPIASLLGAVIKKGEAHIIEFNTAVAVQASIEGRKFYKAGAIWIPHKDVGLGVVRDLIKSSDEDFLAAMKMAADQGMDIATKAEYKGATYHIATPEVQEAFAKMQEYGREMYEIKNARNVALGLGELPDIGLWMPALNPRDKSIAYVFDKHNKVTSMLYAKTDEMLAEGLKNYEDSLLKKHGSGWRGQFDIVTKKDQKYYNELAGRHDDLYMGAADITKQHGGASMPAIVSTDTSLMQEILGGYQHHAQRAVEDVAEIHLDKVMGMLRNISDVSQGLYAEETKSTLVKLSSKPVDAGQTIRNILLNRPLLSEHKAWAEWQQRGQVWTDQAFKTIATAFEPIINSKGVRTPEAWNKVIADMEKLGVVNPFEGTDKALGLGRYMTEGAGNKEMLTPRSIALGNSIAATVMLRFADLAQPLVNAISLPILTSGALNRRFASQFAGAALDPNAKFAVHSAMTDGIRLMNHPTASKELREIFVKNGWTSMELRNVSEILEHQRSLDPGLITKAETFLEKFSNAEGNTSAWRFFTKAADKSEEMVREVSLFTGAHIAKKAYPGLGNEGVAMFARSFMDEVVGNYNAAQRPAMFQGTFGVAMSLFQTYMLTMAQSMYRNIQYKDWATLGKMLLTQTSIFGAGSLPGFSVVSEQIAKNFSDNNIDLETGTVRAVGDPIANVILYGMPSSFGPGISTRGDLQPRIPMQVNNIAAINMTMQAYTAMERVVMAAGSADGNTGKAMLEALSLQSLSRPVARISELMSGQSITTKGDVVATGLQPTNVENLLSLSTFGRIMATRPLEEIKARQALHHNSLYNSFDTEKRQGVTNRLKSYIRNDTLTNDNLESLAAEYMRTGHPSGWRQAQNDAIRQAGQSGSATTLAKLKKDSPLQMLIEDQE